MFRSSRRAGFAVALLLLVDPANAAPPLNTPVPLKSPSLPGDTAASPGAVTQSVLTGVIPTAKGERIPRQDAPPAAPPSNPPPTDVPEQPVNQVPAVTPASRGSGSLLGAALPPVPNALQQVAPDPDTPQYAPHELIAVTASMDDAKRLAQVMGAYQARVIRRHKLGSLGMVLSTFRLPDQVSVADTLAAIHREYPDLWIDLNHYFHPAMAAGGQRTALYRAIDRQPGVPCGRGLRIGLLDGPANLEHPALRGQSIVQKVLFARGRPAAPAQHATAVASLLAGNPAVAGLAGVVSEASLYVGVVMQQGEDDEMYSTAEDLLSGLNWLLDQPVQVVSLSLGGPRNALLEVALQRTLTLGIGVVAAAGNGGVDASPSYPAAQTGVVAVTSVDSDGVIARDASRGDYIDLAAPGVDVWVAAGKTGGRYASGTSMAAPLVAAALAQLGGRPDMATQLFRQARDLGQSGKDSIYGWGLLRFPVCSGAK
ncbi:hypothetical protein MNBD_GAMMA14-2675 [hydrothermal vent metagenome]|uniref:Peptidase S8/S53 domain-containing protein n=1 Tax=hydrothermal vent metagenome TaxID=652676 RepID=A0A3B0ZG61_9ZZZZ